MSKKAGAGGAYAASRPQKKKSRLRQILSLPLQLLKLPFRLPKLLRSVLQKTARLIARLRLILRMARHWRRVNLPRARLRRWYNLYLHPARLRHWGCCLRTRLRGRRAWNASPALETVHKAIRWGRAYRRHVARFAAIEALRSRIEADPTPLDRLPGKPTLGELARRDSFRPRWGALLHGLVFHAQVQRALEINTGFGLGTLYLARGLLDAYPVRTCMLITLDEDTPYTKIARKHITQLAYTDFVAFREGPPTDSLPDALETLRLPDLIFIARPPGSFDHVIGQRDFARLKARAHPGTLIVIEDIHASPGMRRAWEAIRAASRVAATVDLWRWGIVVIGDGPAQHLCAQL